MENPITPPPITPRESLPTPEQRGVGNDRPDAAGWGKWVRKSVFSLALGTTVLLASAEIVIFHPLTQRLLLASAPVPNISVAERLSETQTLLSYFCRGNISLLRGYTLDEVAHLAEVATLVRTVRWLQTTAAIAAIIFGWRIFRQHGGQALRHANRTTLRATAIGSLAALIIGTTGFPILFVWFHKIFFVAAPWAFNPEVSKLVNLYPERYFFLVFATIFALTAVIGWGLSVAFRKR